MCPRAGTKMACRLRWLGFGTTTDTQMASWRIKIDRIGRPPRRPRRKFATHKNNGKKQREPRRRLALGLVALLVALLRGLLCAHGDEDVLSRDRTLSQLDILGGLRDGVAECAADGGQAKLADAGLVAAVLDD